MEWQLLAMRKTIPFLPDESGDGCLPRHEPQSGGIGRQRRSSSREAASAASGRSSRKRSWSMNTRSGTKAKSPEKIDGIVAAIMALDRCIRNEGQQRSVYDERDMIVF